MKKNKMLRTASVLLILVMLTTSIIGGTFAKYTTTDSASDTARVAKWGVTVEVSGNLFGKDYNSNAATEDADKNSISAATSTNVHAVNANVVAPGTKNTTGLTVKIAGTPEVAYKIEADNNSVTLKDVFLGEGSWGVMVEAVGLNAATDITQYYTYDETTKVYTKVTTGSYDATKKYYKLIDQATVESGGYYPIQWKMTKGSTTTTKNKLSEISSEMINAIKTATNQNAGTSVDVSCTLTWEWPFESGTDTDTDANDGADTILGDLAASTMTNGAVVKKNVDDNTYKEPVADTDYSVNIMFGMKVTATQVD